MNKTQSAYLSKKIKQPRFQTRFLIKKIVDQMTCKIKSSEITLFTRQLATLAKAGIPLAESLSLLSDNAFSSAFEVLIRQLKSQIENGRLFSGTLKLYPSIFDELYCSLIIAGEQSGTLDLMLERLAAYREKKDSLKRKVKKALYYPSFVLIITFLITGILLTSVVPLFKEMFEGFGTELPGFTQKIIQVSDYLISYGLSLIISIIGLGYGVYIFYQKKPQFQLFVHAGLLRIPILGIILQKSAIARLTRTLSITTAAGVPLMDALQTAFYSSGSSVYQNAFIALKMDLSAGQPLWIALKKNPLFPMMVVQMVRIGEESGSLETLLDKITTLYEEEVSVEIDGLITLLEPFIMVCLGIIVGGLIIALYLPIFNMGSLL